jgi:Serine aminopeptidase, S33
MMGIITERDSAADGYEAVRVPPAPDQAALRKAALYTATESGGRGVILRRRSALPTRRSVLYLHCDQDTFVPEDLVTWYTERGFHFYVADLRPQDRMERPGRPRGHGPGRGDCFAGLDAACRHLRDTEGIDMIIVSAHSADALTAALWCDARRDAGLADALILSSPAFGRRLRRGLDIACPVLVMSPAPGQESPGGPAGRLTTRLRRRTDAGAVRLGPHVTWLRLEDGLDGPERGPGDDRRRFFDELGRWLGAYMYGQVRDQLL